MGLPEEQVAYSEEMAQSETVILAADSNETVELAERRLSSIAGLFVEKCSDRLWFH